MHEFALEVLTERLTVRELIRSRVYQEVQDHNLRQPEVFRGPVEPSDAERALNGLDSKRPRQIDGKEQYARTTAAFMAGKFLILVEDRQVEGLQRPDDHAADRLSRRALTVGALSFGDWWSRSMAFGTPSPTRTPAATPACPKDRSV